MNHWRSPAGACAILLWTIILLSGAFGCGITREVSLPNGYICYVDKFIWISLPDDFGAAVDDVEQLDVQGDIVFGTRQDYWSDEFAGYFILDTQLQVVWITHDYAEWSNQLADLGIEKRNLRSPGVNFNGFSIWSVLTPLAIALGAIIAIVWFILQFAKHEREIRKDRLDRL